jgi:hypothetical protein
LFIIIRTKVILLKLNNKKITTGTTRKKTHSTIRTASTTIVPMISSATRILRIQKQRSQQTIERKGIRNKKIYLYYLVGTMIARMDTMYC